MKHLLHLKVLLALAATLAAVTGLAFLTSPRIAAQHLLEANVDGFTITLTRLVGAGLFALAIVCWPKGSTDLRLSRQYYGLFVYMAFATIILGGVAIFGGVSSQVLWLAFVLHAALLALLVVARLVTATRTQPNAQH